jgi:hypothetical protein
MLTSTTLVYDDRERLGNSLHYTSERMFLAKAVCGKSARTV